MAGNGSEPEEYISANCVHCHRWNNPRADLNRPFCIPCFNKVLVHNANVATRRLGSFWLRRSKSNKGNKF